MNLLKIVNNISLSILNSYVLQMFIKVDLCITFCYSEHGENVFFTQAKSKSLTRELK